jgi:hypothetical protein
MHAVALILGLRVDDPARVGLEHDDRLELDHDVALLLPQVAAGLEHRVDRCQRILNALRLAERPHLRPTRAEFSEGGDFAPLFRGLPDDGCQCSHWGIVMKGRLTITYADGQDVVEEGEAYYLSPGHTPAATPGTAVM